MNKVYTHSTHIFYFIIPKNEVKLYKFDLTPIKAEKNLEIPISISGIEILKLLIHVKIIYQLQKDSLLSLSKKYNSDMDISKKIMNEVKIYFIDRVNSLIESEKDISKWISKESGEDTKDYLNSILKDEGIIIQKVVVLKQEFIGKEIISVWKEMRGYATKINKEFIDEKIILKNTDIEIKRLKKLKKFFGDKDYLLRYLFIKEAGKKTEIRTSPSELGIKFTEK